jgi:hypothetical protein
MADLAAAPLAATNAKMAPRADADEAPAIEPKAAPETPLKPADDGRALPPPQNLDAALAAAAEPAAEALLPEAAPAEPKAVLIVVAPVEAAPAPADAALAPAPADAPPADAAAAPPADAAEGKRPREEEKPASQASCAGGEGAARRGGARAPALA